MRRKGVSEDVDYVERVFGENDAIARERRYRRRANGRGVREGYY